MSEFTKGEWVFEESDFTIRTKDFSSNAGMGDYHGVIIAHLDPENWRGIRSDSIAEKTANARRICQCVNSHDALLKACEYTQLLLSEENIGQRTHALALIEAALAMVKAK